MTKSKEEREQEQLAQQEQDAQQQRQAQIRANQQQQQQQAQGSQPSITTNASNPNNLNVNQQTAASEHVQTTTNVPRAGAADQDTISQNIEGDAQAHHTNEQLGLLKRIVGQASPIVEDQQETEEQTDADGNVVQVPVTKKVTTGYTYYAIDGQPFEEWVQATFGGDITIDTKENKITYNKDISEIQAVPPQQQQETAQQAQAKKEGNK